MDAHALVLAGQHRRARLAVVGGQRQQAADLRVEAARLETTQGRGGGGAGGKREVSAGLRTAVDLKQSRLPQRSGLTARSPAPRVRGRRVGRGGWPPPASEQSRGTPALQQQQQQQQRAMAAERRHGWQRLRLLCGFSFPASHPRQSSHQRCHRAAPPPHPPPTPLRGAPDKSCERMPLSMFMVAGLRKLWVQKPRSVPRGGAGGGAGARGGWREWVGSSSSGS